MDRKLQLEAMLRDDPADPFLRYGLAMELRKEGDHEGSLKILDGLTGESPPHVPSFLMAAQQLAETGRIDESRAVLRSGIEAARDQGDAHAASEMSELLASLGELG